jgi:hypothetical protein
LPLEEMNYLFTHAPWIVVGTEYTKKYVSHDLENRAAELAQKQATVAERPVTGEEGTNGTKAE